MKKRKNPMDESRRHEMRKGDLRQDVKEGAKKAPKPVKKRGK